MQRTDSMAKTLMLGKIEGGRRRGRQRMRCLDGITDSIDMSLNKLQKWWTGKYGHAAVNGVAKNQTRLSDWTELNWTTAHQASLSITNSQSPSKPMFIESMRPSYHFIFCCPLLLLPSIFPSIRVFSNDSALHIRWPKYWSFSFNISPPNEHPGLIFRMDWLDLLTVQRTLKSLLQHHSSKASILRCSAFFIVQLLHPYMTTGKAIALTRWTFVGKVMSAF